MHAADWFYAPHKRLGRVVYYNEKRGFGFIEDLGVRGQEVVGITFFHTGRNGYCKPEINKGWCGAITYMLADTDQVYPKKGDMVAFTNRPGPQWGKPEATCLCLAKDFVSTVEALAEAKPSRWEWQHEAPWPDEMSFQWWVDTHKLK